MPELTEKQKALIEGALVQIALTRVDSPKELTEFRNSLVQEFQQLNAGNPDNAAPGEEAPLCARPPKAPGEGCDIPVTIYLSVDDFMDMKSCAAALKLGQSPFIRMALSKECRQVKLAIAHSHTAEYYAAGRQPSLDLAPVQNQK